MGLKFCGVSDLKCRLYSPPCGMLNFIAAELICCSEVGSLVWTLGELGRLPCEEAGEKLVSLYRKKKKSPPLMKGLTPLI